MSENCRRIKNKRFPPSLPFFSTPFPSLIPSLPPPLPSSQLTEAADNAAVLDAPDIQGTPQSARGDELPRLVEGHRVDGLRGGREGGREGGRDGWISSD